MASKRSLDEGHLIMKRQRTEADDDSWSDPRDTFAKLLFPSFVAGLVIGKEGGMISELMSQTHTNIKFSPSRELYPGTQERVCIITGYVPDIATAVKGILERIRASDVSHDSADVGRSIKMLVSNIASGMVIGKSGSTVKLIQQEFNVRIQIANKEESKGLPERMMTIVAENFKNVLQAFENILERIIGDPEAEKWRRMISYSGYTIPPIVGAGSSVTSNNQIANPTNSIPPNHAAALQTDYTPLLQAFLQSSNSFPTSGNPFSFLGNSSTNTSTLSANNPFQSNDQFSTNQLASSMLSYMYAQSLISSSTYFNRFPPVIIDGVNLSIPGATLSTYEMAIPEVMVNAVFGANLKVMSDVMQSTGTRMQLSNKGDYIPGTYNRKLTITGPILAVQAAHLTVMQNIVREQEVFRKQGLL